MTTAASFWDRVADRYAASPIKNVPAYEQTMARTRAYLSPEDRVLEIGCGTASTALLLAEHVGHITATDIAPRMAEIGQAKAQDAGVTNIDCLAADVFDRRLKDGAYEVVLAFNLIHLLPEPEAALARVRELLAPNGTFISKTVCLAGRWYLRPVIGAMRLVGKAPYVNFLSVDKMDRLIRQAGFEILETGDYPAKPASHFVVARKR